MTQLAKNDSAGLVLEVKDEVLTRDVEAWMKAVREQRGDKSETTRFEMCTHMLRGAVKAGIVVQPDLRPGDVASLPPAHTRFYGEALSLWYVELTTIPLA